MSNNSVKIQWKRGKSGGTPINNYRLQYSTNYGATWVDVNRDPSTDKIVTLSGFSDNTSYLFRVASVNALGVGTYSKPAFSVRSPKHNFSTAAAPAAVFSVTPIFTPQQAATYAPLTYAKIPAMTSNTAPSGIASSSGDSSVYPTSNYPAWRAFDGVANASYSDSIWLAPVSRDAGGNFSIWLQYEFASPSLIGGYSLSGIKEPNEYMSPSSWTFAGSNDGVNFTVLDTQALSGSDPLAQPVGERKKTVRFAEPVAYKIYRWTLTRTFSTGAPYAGVAAVSLLPPAWDVQCQWQINTETGWKDLAGQTSTTLELTPTMYAAASGNSYAGSARLRCVVGAGEFETVSTRTINWLNLAQKEFYGYANTDTAWSSGTVTENGVLYELITAPAGETAYFSVSDYAASDMNLTWFSGNNWAVTLQTSADGVTWTDYSTANQRTSAPTGNAQFSGVTGTSYWRWRLTHNWPLNATDGSLSYAANPPVFYAGYTKIVATPP